MTIELHDQEKPPVPQKFAIFIDDAAIYAQKWARCFEIPGVHTLFPKTHTFGETDAETLSHFMRSQHPSTLQNTAIVIIDQFADDLELQAEGQTFINKLRAVNQTAWVLESSGNATGCVYVGSSAFFANGLSTNEMHSLINLSPPLLSARLAALQFYRNRALVEAAIADPNYNDDTNRLNGSYGRKQSFYRLTQAPEFLEALTQMGLAIDSESDSLASRFRKLDETRQRLFLHCGWNIVGHMQIGSTLELYGTLFARLKRLLD